MQEGRGTRHRCWNQHAKCAEEEHRSRSRHSVEKLGRGKESVLEHHFSRVGSLLSKRSYRLSTLSWQLKSEFHLHFRIFVSSYLICIRSFSWVSFNLPAVIVSSVCLSVNLFLQHTPSHKPSSVELGRTNASIQRVAGLVACVVGLVSHHRSYHHHWGIHRPYVRASCI